MGTTILVDLGGQDLFYGCDMNGLERRECGNAYAAAIAETLATLYPDAAIEVDVSWYQFADCFSVSDDVTEADLRRVIQDVWNRGDWWPDGETDAST